MPGLCPCQGLEQGSSPWDLSFCLYKMGAMRALPSSPEPGKGPSLSRDEHHVCQALF